VVGVDQGKRLLAWKRLDPHGTREADQSPIQTVELDKGGATSGRLVREIDDIRTLACEEQHGQPVIAADERQLSALCECECQRLGP
jgi:hypothetical protein